MFVSFGLFCSRFGGGWLVDLGCDYKTFAYFGMVKYHGSIDKNIAKGKSSQVSLTFYDRVNINKLDTIFILLFVV